MAINTHLTTVGSSCAKNQNCTLFWAREVDISGREQAVGLFCSGRINFSQLFRVHGIVSLTTRRRARENTRKSRNNLKNYKTYKDALLASPTNADPK